MEEKRKKNGSPKSVGNGEGSLYFSDTLQRWVFQYVDPNGNRQTLRQKKKESERAFRKRVTEIKSKLDNGTYIAKNKDTFIQILENYIEQKYKDGITSDRSYRRNLETVKQIKKCCSNFVNRPIQKITVEEIETAKENIRKYSNSTINKIWTSINKSFQIAYSRRKISFNIMLDETLTKPISNKPQKKVKALTVEEEQKLIAVLNNQEHEHKYRDIILLQLYTGMRIGEVLALSRDCIDLKAKTITVYRTLTQDKDYNYIMGSHTKTYKKSTGIDKGKRTFPMNNNVETLVRKILSYKTTNINGLLFWDNRKQSYITSSEITSYLNRINNKYSICKNSLHSHRLRHTFITRCVEKGINIKALQSIVGHVDGSSITYDVYTSISTDFMKEELKKIN